MNYTYYADYRSYFEHYESPNIVIIPTVHGVTMPQTGNVYYSSVSNPALVNEQIRSYNNTAIPVTGANMMLNNGYASRSINSAAPQNHVAIQLTTTKSVNKNLETIKPLGFHSYNWSQNNLITLTGTNSESPVKKVAAVDSLTINKEKSISNDKPINKDKSINNQESRKANNKTCSENTKDSNSSNTNTERIKADHTKVSQGKTVKRKLYNSSKSYDQNYSNSIVKTNRSHRIDEEFKFKRIKTSSGYKKHSGEPEKLKVSPQEYASTRFEIKDDNLSKSRKQTLSPGSFKRYQDYQNFLRKCNPTKRVKEAETTNSNRKMSLDTNKSSSHSERDKKNKESTSKFNNSVVSTKRVAMSSYLDQNIEESKSNKKIKDNSRNEININIKSNEKLSKVPELKQDEKKNKLHHVKKTLKELNEKRATSMEKEKRKRKLKEEPTSLELKKKKEDYKKTRSHFTESKKKEQLCAKFAPYLELRKKKEEKRKKMEEESRIKHCKNTDLKKKESESNTCDEQHEKNQEKDLKNKKFVRHEQYKYNNSRSTNSSYKKRLSKQEELTKEMQGSRSPERNATQTKKRRCTTYTKRTREINLKKDNYNKREQLKVASMISNSTDIETERNHSFPIRNVAADRTKGAFSSYKIADKMDLRTILMRKRAKNNATELKHFRTETPERENFVITLKQDITANSKPTNMSNISSKSKVKKNKKVKLLISIACDSDNESDNSGGNETNYCTSPFEDLSFLDDLNVDEIVDSLTQKGTASTESPNSVQRIQNLLKDSIKKGSFDEANCMERKRRLLNIEPIHCDSIEIIHSSDDENCTVGVNQVEVNNTDSINTKVNTVPIKSIDDDVYEVIDISNDFENETIIIEHNVEELIEELFGSPTKENCNTDTKNIIEKESAFTYHNDSKQHIQILNKLDSKLDLETNVEKYITTASELHSLTLVMPFTEQKTNNSIKEAISPEQKQHNINIIFEEDMIPQQNDEGKGDNKINIIGKESEHIIEYQNFATSPLDEKCDQFIKTDGDKSTTPVENTNSPSESSDSAIILNKQAEIKLEPKIETGSEEPQKDEAKQSLGVTLSNVTPYFQVTKNNDSFQDTTQSENVTEFKPDITNVEITNNSKFINTNKDSVQKSILDDNTENRDIKTLNLEDLSKVGQLQEKLIATVNDNIIVTEAIKDPQMCKKESQNNDSDLNSENVTVNYKNTSESDKCDDVELCDVNNATNEINTGTTNTSSKMIESANTLSNSSQLKTNKTNVDIVAELTTKNMQKRIDSMENVNEDVLLRDKPNASKYTSLQLKTPVTAYIDKINLDLKKEISFTKVIYKGHYSSIYMCKEKEGRPLAIKMLNAKCKGIHQSEILSLLNKSSDENNRFILNIMHKAKVHGRYFFLSDYYAKNFKEVMAGKKRGFHIDYVQTLAKQLISAVNVLVANKIIHTDINARHVLITRCGKLKLCGFDRAGYVHNLKILPSSGSPRFRAPETILGFYPSYGIDVWSTGLIIFEMVTRRKLFAGQYNNQILYDQLCTLKNFDYGILEECQFRYVHFKGPDFQFLKRPQGIVVPIYDFTGENLLTMKLFESYNTNWRPQRDFQHINREIRKMDMLCDLLEQMLMMDPRKRISITEARAHEFFHNM